MSSSTTAGRDTLAAPARGTTRIGLRRLALAGAALALVAGGAVIGRHWWTVGRFVEHTDDAYVGGNVTAIAPHVAGFVAAVAVADNQRVNAGQLLDPSRCARLSRGARPRRGGAGGARGGAGRIAGAVRPAAIHHSPAGGRAGREIRAGRLRRRRRRPLSRAGADQRRLAPGCAAQRHAGRAGPRRGRRRRGRAAGRARTPESACRIDRRGAGGRRPGARPISTPRGSISATPTSVRRSTVSSATARRRSAPMSRRAAT